MKTDPWHFSRADRAGLGQWWWTVDWLSLAALMILLGLGTLSVFLASQRGHPASMIKSNLFVRHLIFSVGGAALIFSLSMLSLTWVRRCFFLIFFASLLGLSALPFIGVTVKGACRWISLGGFHLQPSEFLKPGFIVFLAWFFAYQGRHHASFSLHTHLIALGMIGFFITVLILQPDFGTSFLLMSSAGVVCFLAGLPLLWVGGLGIISLIFAAGSYCFLPHVMHRINGFLKGNSNPFGAHFQVARAHKALTQGGFWGCGLGEATVSPTLPEAHTDFILAVIAENMGIMTCLFILALISFIVARSIWHIRFYEDSFLILTVFGLSSLLIFQTFINMASVLGLMPAKGMPLPFISYGGSALISQCLAAGCLLACTRRHVLSPL